MAGGQISVALGWSSQWLSEHSENELACTPGAHSKHPPRQQKPYLAIHTQEKAVWLPVCSGSLAQLWLTHRSSDNLFFSFFTVQMMLLRPAIFTALFFCKRIRGSPHPSPCSSEDSSSPDLLSSSTLHIQLYYPANVTRLKKPFSRAASHSSI